MIFISQIHLSMVISCTSLSLNSVLPYQNVEQMDSTDVYSVKLVSRLILPFKNSILHVRKNIRFQISFMKKLKTVLETLNISLNKSFGWVQPPTILLPISMRVYVEFQNCYYQNTRMLKFSQILKIIQQLVRVFTLVPRHLHNLLDHWVSKILLLSEIEQELLFPYAIILYHSERQFLSHLFTRATFKTLTQILDTDSEQPGPTKTCTPKNLEPEKPGPWKTGPWKTLDHEKRGKQMNAEKGLEDHIV